MHTIRQLARRALIATLIVTGAICGVVAVGFHWLIAFADRFLIGDALRQDGAMRVIGFVTPADIERARFARASNDSEDITLI